MARRNRSERRDVPTHLRDLYPMARTRSRRRVVLAGGSWTLREVRRIWARRILVGVVAGPVALGLLLVAGVVGATGGVLLTGLAGVVAVGACAWLARHWHDDAAWQRWARPRGIRATTNHGPGRAVLWEAVVGPRRVRVELEVGSDVYEVADDRLEIAYYQATVYLPDGARDVLPASRVQRNTFLDDGASQVRGGRRLRFESIELDRELSCVVGGGDDLDWYTIFDPALLDLLAEAPGIGWKHQGFEVVVSTRVPRSGLEQPLEDTLDTLCVLAAAVERRVARVVGRGREVAPAFVGSSLGGNETSRDTYLRDARRRDLAMTIEEQFDELARYTSEDEVAAVRAAIDAGTFRVDHLDDLVHHRRARFWGDSGEDADAA